MADHVKNNGNCLFNVCFSDVRTSFKIVHLIVTTVVTAWIQIPRYFTRYTRKTQKIQRIDWYFCRLPCWLLFLPKNLTGDVYLDLLENAFDPALTNIMERNAAYIEKIIVIQHDKAPSHCSWILGD